MYNARPLYIPQNVLDEAKNTEGSLTPVMHRHADNLGDYSLIKAWQRALAKQANWVGNTIPFNYVVDYQLQRQKGETRYEQTMFMNQNNEACGFLRMLHLIRDTDTRRRDCTKIEESLVNSTIHLQDLTLFKDMYKHALKSCEAQGRARVITELGIGFSPQKYNGLARKIAQLKRAGLKDRATQAAFDDLKNKFEKDWLSATLSFIDNIGFNVTDIIIPQAMNSDSTPQLRITQTVSGANALKLPAYAAQNRICHTYKCKDDLAPLNEAIQTYRENAAQKYGLG